jgi:hypothetical protein
MRLDVRCNSFRRDVAQSNEADFVEDWLVVARSKERVLLRREFVVLRQSGRCGR